MGWPNPSTEIAMTAPENPPAFPVPPGVTTFTGDPRDGAGYEPSQEGMSLRDYFAGQALIGLLSGLYRDTSNANLSEVPREALAIADALLAARSAHEQPPTE